MGCGAGPTVPAQPTTPVPETLVITRDELDRLRAFRAAIQAIYDAGGAITRFKVKAVLDASQLTEPHHAPQRPRLDLTIGAGAPSSSSSPSPTCGRLAQRFLLHVEDDLREDRVFRPAAEVLKVSSPPITEVLAKGLLRVFALGARGLNGGGHSTSPTHTQRQ